VNLRAYRRFVVVLWQFLPLIVAYARDRRRFLLFGRSREPTAEQRSRRATRLIDSLVTLGPTFIKLGQLLSTRPDVLPPEYVAEFARLQDDVPPADWSDVEAVLAAELGPVSEVFDDFDRTAISGASLGQVYRAELDGRPVAVKVRRPGIERLVEADLRVIRWSLPLLSRLVDDARSFSLETLAEEFETTIRQEMDYEREARMLREVRANFADDETVRMPTVFDARSTGRVLTMEYVDGAKITDRDQLDAWGIDRTALAERLQRSYMQMLVDDGVFHADPHPGNLAVKPDGTIVFYDFGMSGFVDEQVQDSIVGFYDAAVRRDVDAILDTMVALGVLSPTADRQLMAEVAELAIKDARGQEVDQYRVQQLVEEFEDTIYEFPLRIPPNLALVLRVATVLEGICVSLDHEFDFIDVATTYLREQGYIASGARQYVSSRSEELRAAAGATLRIPPKLERALDTIERDRLTVTAELDADREFDRLAKRLVYGMVLAAGIVASTVLAVFGPPVGAAVAAVLTLLVGALLYRSFRSRRRLPEEPQFTRQRLREDSETREIGDTDADGIAEVGIATGSPSPGETPPKGDSPDEGTAHAGETDSEGATSIDVEDGS